MERVPMRDGYGKALLELCRLHDDVLVLDADVAKSTRTEWIRQEYPEKYINVDRPGVGTDTQYGLL